jgi:DNA-directed RNA polymerase subunit RPC12/RpoP
MALIKCVECGKDISSAAPICPHCGRPQLLKAEPPPPPSIGTIDCPKCAATIKQAALVCPHCSFDVDGYRENIRDAKYTEMTAVPVTDEAKEEELAAIYAETQQGKSCAGWMMLALSGVVWIVPFIGWIAAPIFFILGIFAIGANGSSRKFWDHIFNAEEYKRNEDKALQRVRHRNVMAIVCPNCGVTGNVRWEEAYVYDCTRCSKRLSRYENFLFYLPKPNALKSPNLKAFIEEQANART